MEIFDALPLSKDIDGLSSGFLWSYINEQIDFLGATPQAVFMLLEEYGYSDLAGKDVVIIGQSNLLGKPLALWAMRRGASIMSFNSHSNRSSLQRACLQADIVISATGVVHLLDESYFRDDASQVAIDVGRGKKDNQATGDIDFTHLDKRLASYTPVPGGVGPLTIANLLNNVKNLYNRYK